MKRKLMLGSISVAIVMLFSAQNAMADHCRGKGGDEKCGMDEKFYKKAHMVMQMADEIGLSDEQVDKLKKLKVSVKKEMIMKDAEIDVLALDIKTMMMEDTLNAEEVNTLVDKKYDLKKEKAKSLVNACASMRTILTPDQIKKMKEQCKKQMKDKAGHGMKDND